VRCTQQATHKLNKKSLQRLLFCDPWEYKWRKRFRARVGIIFPVGGWDNEPRALFLLQILSRRKLLLYIFSTALFGARGNSNSGSISSLGNK
jgi:hypothetical protein